ncbi:MAG TPA: hypothetical protein VK917_05430 [Ilumatobacter sp.]|jgi:hypothetical protein|nr:hypothetical protein [Ilumatobacter sp.]
MSTNTQKISPEDLQRKLQSFQDGIQGKVEQQKSSIIAVGGGVLVVLLVLFFLLGKRSGKKKTTLVEIRRI